MTTKGDLCQKSRDPVTTITGILAFDCDGYPDRSCGRAPFEVSQKPKFGGGSWESGDAGTAPWFIGRILRLVWES